MERAELARRLGAASRGGEGANAATVVAEQDPAQFMRVFAAAVAGRGPVFLADPEWDASRRAELAMLLATQSVRGASGAGLGWLMIPSGGTTGRLKLARHDEKTLAAAVRGFCAHFQMQRVNAVGVLPLYHVSGLMAWSRCVMTGGEFQPWEWKRLQAGETPTLAAGDWVISLVPTQLQRLLGSPRVVDWLRRFRIIFVSGGPMWPELAETALAAGLPIAISYGMTETAAMVAALRPEEFRAGHRSCGRALPHARVNIDAEGVIAVGGESLFRGYWPGWREPGDFLTEDLGVIDERGHVHIHGRRDAVIISGGKKIQPAGVEAALRASGEFSDVAVIGVPDTEWGEAVVACYPTSSAPPDVKRAVALLAPHERPKRFLAMAEWPRNAQGKIDRTALRALAQRGNASSGTSQSVIY